MKNKSFILIFVIVSFLSACKKKVVVNEGSMTAEIQIFNECGIPMSNKPIRLYCKKSSYANNELVASGITDSNGKCILKHAFYNMAPYKLKSMPNTLSGDLIEICEYKMITSDNYSIIAVNKGNGGQIPIQLENFNSYTSNDTIYYQALGNVGSTDPTTDLSLRYKVGPFNSTFIDTLSFPSCTNPSIISSTFTDKLQIKSNAVQNNVIAWGVGYNDFIFRKSNDTSSAHIINFKQVGCGILDTLFFN